MRNGFRLKDVTAVWGDTPYCVHTGTWSQVDMHHIFGRTARKGSPKGMMSSVFNSIPLRRDIHKGGLRDQPDQRAVYLRLAKERVMQAVGNGRYDLKPSDEAFLEAFS